MAEAVLSIELSAIRMNWRNLSKRANIECGAVVKADAYGLGAGPVAMSLAHEGARSFFVASAEEGTALRKTLGSAPKIFVFSGHMEGDSQQISQAQLIPLLNSTQQIIRHFEATAEVPFGLQLDTGMNRLGLEPAEWNAIKDMVLSHNPQLIMSHLACADTPNDPMNKAQLDAFVAMTQGINVPRSLSATGGILLGGSYGFDMGRPGIGLYGAAPYVDARPVVQLSVPVIQTRVIQAGESVGYGRAYIAPRPRRIATISAGYADGLLRAASGKISFFSGDTPCPVVGRISMDLTGVDISDLREPPAYLTLFSTRQSIDHIANAAGTIGYEILTSLGARYRRSYRA